MKSGVVVNLPLDPDRGPFPAAIGQLVPDAASVEDLRRRGYVLLPVEEHFFCLGGASAYFRRDWGHGVEVNWQVPKRFCRMLLEVNSGTEEWLHLAVGLRSVGRHVDGSFQIGIQQSPGSPPASFRPHSPVSVGELRWDASRAVATDPAYAVATARAHYAVLAGNGGVQEFALWGRGSGWAVEWTAITHSEQAE